MTSSKKKEEVRKDSKHIANTKRLLNEIGLSNEELSYLLYALDRQIAHINYNMSYNNYNDPAEKVRIAERETLRSIKKKIKEYTKK